jgi:hypothetical protein
MLVGAEELEKMVHGQAPLEGTAVGVLVAAGGGVFVGGTGVLVGVAVGAILLPAEADGLQIPKPKLS